MIFAVAASTSSTFIANIDWSKPTWDLFIVLFFIIASFLYGLSLGRDRILVILVSIYMSLAVVNTAPYISNFSTEVGINQFFVIRISMFLGVFIVLFLLLSRSALLQTIASSDKKGGFFQIMIFSILHVGLLISITLSFLPDSSLNSLSPLTKTIFASEVGRFVWIVAPIVLMILLKSGKEKKFKYEV
ncbi:MAG: hypothetical protein PHI73_02570 [Patescibacteria group bacterium]|nr:hypothetical protein [Patescibacteria group bacterium]